MRQARRRLPIGAEVQPTGGVHFRVWAPDARRAAVVIERIGSSQEVELERDQDGYATALVAAAAAGDRYRFKLDDKLLADPASRYQPDGPFGPSEIVDPSRFAWTDASRPGVSLPGQVVYEMHCGTFTPEGTWRAAIAQLPQLAALGITVLEVMPIAEFPGRFGWGYDGVFTYAPTRLYGTPDDFRAFINRAHELQLAVILDVVYNHFGPDGCVFREYSKDYFASRYNNEWGEGLNFDGERSAHVREYFIENAGHWIDEYHLDGLRLDATQSIHDTSAEHVLAAIARRAREAAGDRTIILIAENECQHTRLVRPPAQGGYGLDGLWNDDFHHSAVVALTGHAEAYFSDHRGWPQEFISAAKYGYLFQGQRYAWQCQARGQRSDGLPPSVFVNFIENHDQVANTATGARLHRRSSLGQYRAMTALLLLLPGTPMLFQGQEMGSSAPFLYFADHEPELARAVREGRGTFLTQFPSMLDEAIRAALPAPDDPATFERCKLHWEERDEHAPIYRMHRDLLQLRRADAAFRAQAIGALDGAVLGPELFLLHFATDAPRDERLLVVNLGSDVTADSFAEPLLAPPQAHLWEVRWSSEDHQYGGEGTPPIVTADGWHVPGHSAVVLGPVEATR